MAITVFADVTLPNAIVAAGVRGKNMRMNSRTQMDSGQEAVNVIWTQTLRQFELGIVPLRVDQWQTLETLHEITEGGAYGLLMEDPKDSSVSNGVASLVSTGIYQLKKRYLEPTSGRTKDRTITRPRAAGFVIKNSGTPIGSGSYTLDVTTGRITIPSNPTAANLTWTGNFYVPVHFMEDTIDWELVISGPADSRFAAGPQVVLQEVRE